MSQYQWQTLTDGLVQDSSNSIANALELLQPCIKPLIMSQSLLILWDLWHVDYFL